MFIKSLCLAVLVLSLVLPASPQQSDTGQPSQTPSPQVAPPPRVRVSAGVAEANLQQKVNPVYPQMAKIAHISGDVVLQVAIGKDGAVENIRAVSGHPILIQSAIDAVKQWKYRPYLLNNNPVGVETTVTVKFRMDEKSSTSETSPSSEPPLSSVYRRSHQPQALLAGNLMRPGSCVFPPQLRKPMCWKKLVPFIRKWRKSPT